MQDYMFKEPQIFLFSLLATIFFHNKVPSLLPAVLLFAITIRDLIKETLYR